MNYNQATELNKLLPLWKSAAALREDEDRAKLSISVYMNIYNNRFALLNSLAKFPQYPPNTRGAEVTTQTFTLHRAAVEKYHQEIADRIDKIFNDFQNWLQTAKPHQIKIIQKKHLRKSDAFGL